MPTFLRRWLGQVDRQSPAGCLATHDDIRACFRLLMGRPPNPEEWSGYSSHAGRPLEDVVRLFVGGKSFQDRGLLASLDGDYSLVDVDGMAVAANPRDIDVGIHVLGGAYEPHVSAAFRRNLKPGMRVFDVGANIGYFTALALACVGSSGHVWAIEPNASNVRLLEAARRHNKVANLTIIPAAAGDTFAPLKLDAPYSNGVVTPLGETQGDLSKAAIVCQVRLDSLVGEDEQVDFIKLDIEGSEYRALRGFERTIDRCSPMLAFEFAPGMLRCGSGISGADFLQYIIGKGYAVGVIGRDGSATLHDTAEPIMAEYLKSGIDHLDLFAARGQISQRRQVLSAERGESTSSSIAK